MHANCLIFMFNRPMCERFPETGEYCHYYAQPQVGDLHPTSEYRPIIISQSLPKLYASLLEHDSSIRCMGSVQRKVF